MQVPLRAAEDVLRHEFSDHVIEGVMKDRLRVVVGIVLGMDQGTSSIVHCCIVHGIASIVAAGVDCHLKGAQSSAMHALSVECVRWNGLVNTQSRDDTIDVINPSQDTACVLSSLEVTHVELVLGRSWH
jgi:hypothetical protein